MPTPEEKDFHVDLTFTGQNNKLVVPLAVASAVIIIIGIIASMTTNFAARLLPMSDEYLQVLVPLASDGKEALSLKTLDNVIANNTLQITGTVGNRTDFPLSAIVAVVDAQDVTGVRQSIEVPLDAAEIPVQGTAAFQAVLTLPNAPGSFSIKFRLADGPVIPHRDDRAATYGFEEKK